MGVRPTGCQGVTMWYLCSNCGSEFLNKLPSPSVRLPAGGKGMTGTGTRNSVPLAKNSSITGCIPDSALGFKGAV